MHPRDEADAEGDGVDAAHARQLNPCVGDAFGRHACTLEGNVVAHEVAQQRGAAGNESREATGVACAELNATTWIVVEVQQRAGAARALEFVPPLLPDRRRHIHRHHARVVEPHR